MTPIDQSILDFQTMFADNPPIDKEQLSSVLASTNDPFTQLRVVITALVRSGCPCSPLRQLMTALDIFRITRKHAPLLTNQRLPVSGRPAPYTTYMRAAWVAHDLLVQDGHTQNQAAEIVLAFLMLVPGIPQIDAHKWARWRRYNRGCGRQIELPEGGKAAAYELLRRLSAPGA